MRSMNELIIDNEKGVMGPLFVMFLLGLPVMQGNRFSDGDYCGGGVALRHLKNFHPFIGRTEKVRLDVTDVTNAYRNIADYVEQTQGIIAELQTRTVTGRPECEKMFYWPDKYVCLMKKTHSASKAAWECELIGYSLYRPLNRERDIDLFVQLKKEGIEHVPVAVDASGQAIFNGDGEFLVNSLDKDLNETESMDTFPVVVYLGTLHNQPQLVISLNHDDMWLATKDARILCETETVPYEKGSPFQSAFEHTAEEFIDYSPEFILRLRNQFKEFNSTNHVEFGYPKLKLRLGGVTRKVLKSTHRLAGKKNWREEEIASSLYPTLEDFEKLPLSNDGKTYEIDIKDIKQAKITLRVGTGDYVDSQLLFRVDRVVVNRNRRYAYGNLTARLASGDKLLKQYELLPYNEMGKVVDERYMYDWGGDRFVSGTNIENSEECFKDTCELENFLRRERGRERSCANFLLKKGGGEGSCRYKEYPWPVAYRLTCDGNVTSIVSSPEPVNLRVDCGNLQSKDVLFSMGQTLFESVCKLAMKGVTLLPLEPNRGPKFIPSSYVDPNSGDYLHHLQYSAIGLLFGVAFIGTYAACRIFKHQPFCCCSKFCGIKCREPDYQESEGDCADDLSLASFTSRNNSRRAARPRTPFDPSAPPPNYGDIARRMTVSESTGGYRTVDRRDLLTDRNLAGLLVNQRPEQEEEEAVEGDLLGAAMTPRQRIRAEAPETRGSRRQ